MASHLTIGQVAKAAGVNLQTIRFYERAGLLVASARSSGGYRLYGREELRRLLFIKRAQVLGFTLKEIAELLSLQVKGTGSCRAVQEKATRKLLMIEQKVKDLRALARTLRRLLRSCEMGRPTGRCPILDSLADIEADLAICIRTRARAIVRSRARGRGCAKLS